MTCPPFAELVAAHERPAAQPDVLAHVGGCRECSQLWAALALLPDAPRAAAWRDVAASLSEAARRVGAGPVRAARDAIASVIFDSAAGALQLDLALLADAPDGGDTLVGQVAGLRDASAASCLLAGAAGARWTPLEGNGDFRFDRVAPGRYLLSVEDDDQRLLVPDLDLSTPTPRDPLR